jgi:hypothetical protein
MMAQLRDDVRCLNCGAYATNELEEVAALLDELLRYNSASDRNLSDLLETVDKLIEAWIKV